MNPPGEGQEVDIVFSSHDSTVRWVRPVEFEKVSAIVGQNRPAKRRCESENVRVRNTASCPSVVQCRQDIVTRRAKREDNWEREVLVGVKQRHGLLLVVFADVLGDLLRVRGGILQGRVEFLP